METQKRKVTSFFTEEDTSIVRQAVLDATRIATRSSILLKAFYLSKIESTYGKKPHKIVGLQPKPVVDIDQDLLDICFSVVQGHKGLKERALRASKSEAKANQKADKKSAKRTLFTEVLRCYDDCFSQHQNISSNLSLSYPLDYLKEQLQTAIENNITVRYLSYVKRYVRHYLASLDGCVRPTKQHSAEMWKSVKMILGVETPDGFVSRIPQHVADFLVPNKPNAEQSLLYDLKCRPAVYLERMVLINRGLEAMLAEMTEEDRRESRLKLLSPISMFTSFVPLHIRLDTSGIAQLLMCAKRIKAYVVWYEALYGIKLNVETKGNLLSSFNTAVGRPAKNAAEEAEHATRMWMFLCNFGSKKFKTILRDERKTGVWCFDNSINTDGYSVSFQMVREEGRKRKKFTDKRKKKKSTMEEDNLQFPSAADDCVKSWWLTHQKDIKLLAGDPGKHDLLALTDGIRTLAYTKRQRDIYTRRAKRETRTQSLRKAVLVSGDFGDLHNPSLDQYETVWLSHTSSKTCVYSSFKDYIARREGMAQVATQVYAHAHFRQSKFCQWAMSKGSDDSFADKLLKFFSEPVKKFPKPWQADSQDPVDLVILESIFNEPDNKTIVIAYGNWGKTPNALKGCAPTPGIGLRRRVDAKLRELQKVRAGFPITITTPEDYTSQTCPCCKNVGLVNPVLEKKNYKKYQVAPEAPQSCAEKHHLLRCPNEHCQSRFWNRNVAGAYNILHRFLEIATLQGTNPPG
jgi:hypothetical protein